MIALDPHILSLLIDVLLKSIDPKPHRHALKYLQGKMKVRFARVLALMVVITCYVPNIPFPSKQTQATIRTDFPALRVETFTQLARNKTLSL